MYNCDTTIEFSSSNIVDFISSYYLISEIAEYDTELLNSIEEEKLATKVGYFPIFRRNPETNEFKLDSDADFEGYMDFLMGETRYKALKKINPEKAEELYEQNKKNAIERFEFYKNLDKTKES